jgi:hypothetical protein
MTAEVSVIYIINNAIYLQVISKQEASGIMDGITHIINDCIKTNSSIVDPSGTPNFRIHEK